MMFFWMGVFVVALLVMVKGADWLLESAEKIGRAFGMSSFLIGVLIVGLGTSLPELAAAIFGVLDGVPEVVVSNAVGSNVSNILLIVGVAAIIGGSMRVKKDLIDIDLPLLAISTVIFVGVVFDQVVTRGEAILLLISYGVHLLYMIFHTDHEKEAEDGGDTCIACPKDYVMLFVGMAGLIFGAKYVITSVVALADIFHISPALISITAVAIGTSLPELIVSIKAARARKPDIAIGNIFGSNAFNALVVVGIPALFVSLPVDDQTFFIGVPIMAMATLLFIVTGISRRIHVWEGAMYLVFFVFFIGKLFGLL